MKRMLMLTMVALPVGMAMAELKTWTGAEGDGIYQTAGNWDPAGVPAATDDILVESGDITYVPGGDWTRAAGTTFTMKGGSFTQVESIAYMQISGAIVIEGGTFSMGTAGQLVLQSSGSITVSGGSFQPKTIDNHGGAITVTGGEYVITGNHVVKSDGAVELAPEATMTINGELQFGAGSVTLGAGNYVCNLVSGTGVLNLDGSKVYSKGGFICGVYNGTHVNFVSANGNAASYTFNGTDAAKAYTDLFAPGLFTLDGETVDEDAYAANFLVSSNDGKVTVQLVVDDVDWRVALASVTDVTDTAAKAMVSVKKVNGTDGALYYALGATKAEVEEASLSTMTFVKDGVAADETQVVDLTDLVPETTYYVGFFLVSKGEIVAATQVASFTATNYDNVYVNGDWTNGAPVPGQRLLFKEAVELPQAGWNNKSFASFAIDVGEGNVVAVGAYTGITLTGELVLKSGGLTVDGSSYLNYAKLVLDGGLFREKNADLNFNNESVSSKYEFRSGVFVLPAECATGDKVTLHSTIFSATGFVSGGALLTAESSRLISTRRDRRGDLPFGLYQQHHFFDFVTGPITGNVIPPACGYGYTYDYEGDNLVFPAQTNEQIVQELFTEGRITLNGETVTAADFAAKFVVYDDEDDHSQLVTMFTPMDETTKGVWTMMNGAVVRLTGRTTISGLTIEGGESIVDLNGNRLSVTGKNAFVVGGQVIERGDFTASQINEMAGMQVFRGAGSISVGKCGFAVIIR